MQLIVNPPHGSISYNSEEKKEEYLRQKNNNNNKKAQQTIQKLSPYPKTTSQKASLYVQPIQSTKAQKARPSLKPEHRESPLFAAAKTGDENS